MTVVFDHLSQGSTMTRYHTATAGAALAFAMSIGLAIPSAQAAPLGMSNHITYRPVDGTNNEVYLIDVQGVVTMSQAAAQDSINHGYTVQLRYWGDDSNTDDLLYGPIAAPNVFADADGLHFQHNVTLPRSQLNEDDSTLESLVDSEADEIYVGARFLDRGGKTVSLAESNRIIDFF
jgi:hypothetical protein